MIIDIKKDKSLEDRVKKLFFSKDISYKQVNLFGKTVVFERVVSQVNLLWKF